MTNYTIGTREEWLEAHAGLLELEMRLTRMGDELARQRRELPWVPVEKEYVFQTEDGHKSLAELFDGRSQLAVYHFMFGPTYTSGCPTNSSIADSFNGLLSHLAARDVTMTCVSGAPIEKLLAYKRRMGWSFNWASSLKGPNTRCGGPVTIGRGTDRGVRRQTGELVAPARPVRAKVVATEQPLGGVSDREGGFRPELHTRIPGWFSQPGRTRG